MARGGKLTKIKSVLKKWNSFGKQSGGLGHRRSANSVASAASDDDDAAVSAAAAGDLRAVLVGKSRRRYLVGAEVADHPLFRELVGRSSAAADQVSQNDALNVSCEVVLFEHLLWMLENADPQPESLDELVEFYAC
uniref:Small auxin up regulated protein n=1 Tax=Boehmeria nivea TaxID=83906 RepID=A0A172J1Y0_BOENI|nr:small auxin up regulated protein [Boehmeria nivea]